MVVTNLKPKGSDVLLDANFNRYHLGPFMRFFRTQNDKLFFFLIGANSFFHTDRMI